MRSHGTIYVGVRADAVKPEDWDDEEDGEWEAALVPNPKCAEAPGCGEWVRPTKSNPAYKGKWSAPMIDNPDYKVCCWPLSHAAMLLSDHEHGYHVWSMQQSATI